MMKTEEFLKKVSDLLIEYEGGEFQVTTVGCILLLVEQKKTYSFDGEKMVEIPGIDEESFQEFNLDRFKTFIEQELSSGKTGDEF